MPTALESNSGQSFFRVRQPRILDWLAFCMGLISFLYVNVIGQLYVVESAALLLLPLVWREKHRFLLQKPATRILIFGLLWLLGQIATDIVKGTPWHDLARGWSAIGIFLVEFAVVYMLVSEREQRLYGIMFGAAVGGLIQQFVQPSPYFSMEPWKFGYGPPLALLLVAWLGRRYRDNVRTGILPVILLLIFGALSIFLNARSLGGFIALTGLLIWFRGTALGRMAISRKLRPGRAIFLAAAVIVLATSVMWSYKYAATQGWLGEKARQKYEMDTGGKLGLLIGGRVEVIPAIFAVTDSPILGHGSWARDARYRHYLLLARDLGYGRSEAELEQGLERSDLIPAHSHILQAWVWAGILGALFWLVVLLVVMRTVMLTFRFPNRIYIPVLFLGLNDVWNILFSPFGSEMRFHWALTLTVFLTALKLSAQRSAIERYRP
jgi:hypothetical protein